MRLKGWISILSMLKVDRCYCSQSRERMDERVCCSDCLSVWDSERIDEEE